MLALIVAVALIAVADGFASFGSRLTRASSTPLSALEKDSQGYLVKPRDWFNGLSTDPGDSLNDPRSMPAECKAFAEDVKSGKLNPSFEQTIAMIDANFQYFAVPMKIGDLISAPNVNVASSKIFAFGLMTRMDEASTLKMFGEIYSNLDPAGSDHPNIRNFMRDGWGGVFFETGLSILSKLTCGDDTDTVLSTQAINEGDSEWDPNSDSWFP